MFLEESKTQPVSSTPLVIPLPWDEPWASSLPCEKTITSLTFSTSLMSSEHWVQSTSQANCFFFFFFKSALHEEHNTDRKVELHTESSMMQVGDGTRQRAPFMTLHAIGSLGQCPQTVPAMGHVVSGSTGNCWLGLSALDFPPGLWISIQREYSQAKPNFLCRGTVNIAPPTPKQQIATFS